MNSTVIMKSPDAVAQRRPRVSRSPVLTAALLWGFACLALALFALKRLFSGELVNADAMDYAQIARNLATGHGFSTSIFRPLALSGFVSPANGVVPDLSHAPLYPCVLALAFLGHGGHGGAFAVVLTSLFFFLLSVAGVYVLARTLLPALGPWPALLAMGLYVLGGTALGFAASGLPVGLTTLLLTALVVALHRAHESASRPALPVSEIVVGALLGLCFLAQYSLLLLVVPTLLYVFASRAPIRAWRGVGLCALGFVLVTAGWLVHMASLTGNPFFNLRAYDIMADTQDYPGPATVYRSAAPQDSPFAFFFAHLPQMLAKAGRGLGYYQTHLLDAFNVFVLAAALAALLWRFADVRLAILRGYVALCLVLLVGVSVFFAPSVQIIAPFAPLLCVLAVGFAFELMRRQDWQPFSQRLTAWGWAVLVSGGLFALLVSPAPSASPLQRGLALVTSPPLKSPAATVLHDQLMRGAILTDTPWEIAWRTQLPAVWLPRDNQAYQQTLARTTNARMDVPLLLLTPNISGYVDGTPGGNAWLQFYRHPDVWDLQQRALSQTSLLPQQIEARAADLRRRIAAHDPHVALSQADLAAQLADARRTMPERIRQAQDTVQQSFGDSYGPISEVVRDYGFLATQPETDQLSSTLYIRRDALRGAAL